MRRTVALLSFAAFAANLIAASGASAVSFGISEPVSVCANWTAGNCSDWSSGFTADASTPLFSTLAAALPLRYARFSAAYNLLGDYDQVSGRCRRSYAQTTGGEDGHGYQFPGQGWDVLKAELVDAHDDGLAPLVVVGDGRQFDAQPHGTSDPLDPDPLHYAHGAYAQTVAAHDYACGTSALIAAVRSTERALGAPAAQWEALDEPDARPAYNGPLRRACASPSASQNACAGRYRTLCAPRDAYNCGPLEAAYLYIEMKRELGRAGVVAAGVFTTPRSYGDGYMHELLGTLHERPAVISFHDYLDPTANSTAIARRYATHLYRRFGGHFALWITESGVHLDEHVRPSAGGCEFGTLDAPDVAGGLGQCVDGNPAAQAAGAMDFKDRLAQQGSYRTVRITEAFWYQYQGTGPGAGGNAVWDSGLLDSSGLPRESFCALAGISDCEGNPYLDSDVALGEPAQP